MSTFFIVPGEPVTWKRARHRGPRSFTDPAHAMQMERVRAFARQAGIRTPIAGPVRLRLAFYRGRGQPTDLSTGDLDNLEKLVKDALSRIAYRDDRQVVEVWKCKAIAPGSPRTEIEVTAL